jgi:hypothetical protein
LKDLSSSQESLGIVLWAAVFVVSLALIGLTRWAKKLGRQARIPFWQVDRMRNRYEPGVLNGIALILSLVVVPISAIVLIIAIYLYATDNALTFLIAPIGMLLGTSRDVYMALCDIFAKRTPAVV